MPARAEKEGGNSRACPSERRLDRDYALYSGAAASVLLRESNLLKFESK